MHACAQLVLVWVCVSQCTSGFGLQINETFINETHINETFVIEKVKEFAKKLESDPVLRAKFTKNEAKAIEEFKAKLNLSSTAVSFDDGRPDESEIDHQISGYGPKADLTKRSPKDNPSTSRVDEAKRKALGRKDNASEREEAQDTEDEASGDDEIVQDTEDIASGDDEVVEDTEDNASGDGEDQDKASEGEVQYAVADTMELKTFALPAFVYTEPGIAVLSVAGLVLVVIPAIFTVYALRRRFANKCSCYRTQRPESQLEFAVQNKPAGPPGLGPGLAVSDTDTESSREGDSQM